MNNHGHDTPWKLEFQITDEKQLAVVLSGKWYTRDKLPDVEAFKNKITADKAITTVTFNCDQLESFDTGLLLFVEKIILYSKQNHIAVNTEFLPSGLKRLLKLITLTVIKPTTEKYKAENFVTRVGIHTLNAYHGLLNHFDFIGNIVLTCGRLLIGRGFFSGKDLADLLFACSVQALGIVSLIAFLVGVILAFIGSLELSKFGAQIYVANLTSVGMARELGPIMTAIVMSGRTGAAFAAHIGTMQVNEEIDALTTTAISPIDFIVLPRLLSLIIIMPILTVYAMALGNLGGFSIGTGLLKISSMEYINQVKDALTTTDIMIGVFKGFIFGTLVAYCGCLRGMQSGRSALAVGQSTTSAVVSAIVLIITADTIIDFVLHILEI